MAPEAILRNSECICIEAQISA